MSTPYEARVAQLEGEGMTTSDAQGVADVEFAQRAALPMLAALRKTILYAEKLERAAGLGGPRNVTLNGPHEVLARAEGRS